MRMTEVFVVYSHLSLLYTLMCSTIHVSWCSDFQYFHYVSAISFLTPCLLFLLFQCLRPPYGVAYLATKKNYVGFNSGTRHLRNLVDEEGIFGAHLVKEIGEREIWKFFLK